MIWVLGNGIWTNSLADLSHVSAGPWRSIERLPETIPANAVAVAPHPRVAAEHSALIRALTERGVRVVHSADFLD